MVEQFVQIRRTCRTCHGEGNIDKPHCQVCQHVIPADDPWWQSDEDVLPCGHSVQRFVGWITCPECQGSGRSQQWISEAEQRAIQRQKIARIVFVATLSLIPVAVLAAVIIREPQYLCGSWWYGAIVVLTFMASYQIT